MQPGSAVEVHLDTLAHDHGIDPVELRRRNLVEPYTHTVNGLRITSCALGECLDQVVERSEFHPNKLAAAANLHASNRSVQYQPAIKRGLGIAASAYICGAGKPIYWNDLPHSPVQLRPDPGGGGTVY